MAEIATLRDGKYVIHHLAWNAQQLPHYFWDVSISGLLAGVASVRCSRWSGLRLQPQRFCSLVFREESRLLVCSTSLHRRGEIMQILIQHGKKMSKWILVNTSVLKSSSNLETIY
ncbi:hypothetical protein I4U23_017424 [Adineta vaga]|nr:hypothetical protein I4U23_017424 [Adineta vaga]